LAPDQNSAVPASNRGATLHETAHDGRGKFDHAWAEPSMLIANWICELNEPEKLICVRSQ
jgi:hypothetical protein